MQLARKITPCLWFDDEGEDAAKFYAGIFPNSKVGAISRYGEAGKEFHQKPVGSAMTVEFELNGQPFMALNGGPIFTFNEAISFQVFCETQGEVDYYWGKLTEGGEESMCGWLKDKFGLSWQVIPTVMIDMISDPDPVKSGKAMEAMLQMKKLDIDAAKRAYEG